LTSYTSFGILPFGKECEFFSGCGSFSAAFFISGIANSSSHGNPHRPRLPGPDTLECGSWRPLFRRQIRTPAEHPQAGSSQEKQLRFDNYVNP